MSWNLPGAPWLIAHNSMLPINQPQLLTIAGKDYVLWKNSQGEISALENACPHLGAKLSDGWICPQRNTITCPFHAIEFDNQGRALLPKEKISQPLANTLKLEMQGDFIWTYANQVPRIPIPNILEEISGKYRYIGATKNVTIKTPFLYALEVNHDLNHAKGTHRPLFKIESTEVHSFEAQEYFSVSRIKHFRAQNTWQEYLKNIALFFTPNPVELLLENYFPHFVIVYSDSPLGELVQVFVIYPETENTTKMFILLFVAKSFGILNPILEKATIKAAEEIIYQDTSMIENLYPRSEPTMRLPHEESWHWARNLYLNW
ncbi:Rieske 2Fe-2S domain-containing protein [Calothrix sp. 336/3]|uniref:Rieske 2Fe-2S domain-containing protein n=1 Tax=Calothrix sp. 336/3 TaxID=1337936 RepID=UPI0004E3A5E5|nr:Rieske 2Fe-2S domain-containing protein [Calothrix sp. 336/3]AKG22234.1 hypothetical protein IJ00_14040 [Calothrix sp. 336/3]